MTMWFRLAVRELLNHRGFSVFFILNLMTGLVGFIALDSFKLSLHQHIQHQSKSILAADLSVYAAHKFRPEEIKVVQEQLPQGTTSTARLSFMSMIRGSSGARLVELVALKAGYPLYGKMILSGGRRAGPQEVKKDLLSSNHVWVQPELLQILGLKVGDYLQVGKVRLLIQDQLLEAPGQSFWGAGIAYKVFLSYDQVEKSGLMQVGSRRYHNRLYKLPVGYDADQVASKIKKALQNRFGLTSHLSIRTHSQANQQMSKVLAYLNDYLGLVALVALFLAGLGTAFLFHTFLNARLKELAILRALGATPGAILWFSVLQIALLGLIASLLACVLAGGLLPLLASMAHTFLPLGFVAQISYQSMLFALLVGILGSVLFCLPLLLSLFEVKPKLLLNEQEISLFAQAGLSSWSGALAYFPLVLVYWLLSVWQSHSWVTGSLFLGALVVSSALLCGFALLCLKLASQPRGGLPLVPRLALRNLSRGKGARLTGFLAIGIGSLLINLIPQLHQGIATEIASPLQTELPSFFLFDIQPEQVKPLHNYVQTLGFRTKNQAAMVLARLVKINSKPIKVHENQARRTREAEREEFIRNRDLYISFRPQLYDSETLLEGHWLMGPYQEQSGKLPEISLETKFASRLGIEIGDQLTFDVQGVAVQGQVTSTRKVRWNSFTPNFFVLFQPGVLEYAPATWLATIYHVPESQKVGLQSEIVKRFSNISVLNVTRVIQKILGIAGQIRWAIQVMALFVVIAGMVVIYSIASFNAQARAKEINLMKILGASFMDLRWMVIIEFGALGALAASAGALISVVFAWGVAQIIFERLFSLNPWLLVYTISGITMLSVITAVFGANKALRQSPAKLLQTL